jgi:hypothetical protein
MDLKQTVSKIIGKKVSTDDAKNFANEQFGVLSTVIREKEQIAVVAIGVGYDNARQVCELVEGDFFNGWEDLRKQINQHLEIEDDGYLELPIFFSLSDFMDTCNNQEIDLEGYFISYCKILNL